MSIARDGSSRVRDRKTSTNLRAEYTDLINADEGLIEARRWIERVTFTKFKNNDFRESLADGVLLCELVVNVASMSIGRINRSSTQYAGIDNIKLFIRACEALGFEKSQLFDADDLQEVPVKRGQSVLERAKESQQRLRRVALTVYHLGKYANEHLNFTGSSVLKEECFSHLLENNLPELPVLEGADLGRRASQYEISQAPILETTPEKDKKENTEIVTETGNFSAKRNTFQQLEQESIKQAEEEALQRSRRRSFSSGDKENEFDSEEALKRRKSLGSKPVWKEGDSRYKHKREILGGWKDPIKSRRERIENSGSTDGSPPKHQISMRSPGDLQKKKSKFEEMERTASEEADVHQGKRTRPKSWVGGDIRSRSVSLKDKTNKFEDMQRQADKESAVLHGELRMPAVNNDVKRHDRSPVLTVGAVNLKDKHSKFERLDKAAHQQTLVLQGRRDEVETDFTHDIGDKVNGPISLPGAADPKLQDKKKQFETLDYKAQRESTILRLHSGKSFDDPNQNPIPLNTASRRADPKPRPKSNIFDYQRFPPVDIDRREILNESVQPKEMDFSESTPEQWNSFDDHGSSKSVSPTPLPPARGDSLRYNANKQDENVRKSDKTPLYSSFAAQQDPSKDKGQKNKEMKYKEFISYPVVKQRDRVDRYNAAIQGLSKEPPPKNITTGEKPRKKSLNSNEWIKHKAQEEPEIELPKRQIKKIWDREPDAEEEEVVKKPLEPVDTSFDERKISTHVANVQNMSYRDFTAAPKNLAKDRVISRAPVVELVSSRKKSENRNEPFSNFAQPASDDVKNTTKKKSMSYHDFAVPPPKVESKADAAAKAQKVKEMTRKFQDLEAEQNKPKPAGPPGLKSLVDRDELVRYERESRARSWYGVDDEEFEGATRRRVRRWSDYEYEEGDKMRDAPREMQNGDANNSEVHPSVFNEPEPYRKPIEPEPVRVQKNRPVESAKESIEPEPYRKPIEPEPFRVQETRPVESAKESIEPEPYRKPLEPEPVRVQETRPVESAKEWYDIRPPPPVPVAPKETEVQPEVMRPVKSILRHDPLTTVNHYEPRQPEPRQPEPAHERYQTEAQPQPNQTRTQPRAVLSHGRTVGSRSWNDFESARRKKSMELLENRPTAKLYETRDTTKVESEPYKLKRPTDYLTKHHFEQAPKPTRQTNQQPEPLEAHQYSYESQPENSQIPNRNSMPTSYPTYYEPDVSAGYSPAAVETGKPLFVSARLHEDDEIQMKQKPPSASPSYDIPVAEKVSPPEVESNVESEPHDFKAQQRLWEYKTTQIHEEPVPPQPDVVKNDVKQPEEVHKYVIDPEPVRQRQEEPPKPHRPQVFAIVGTAHPVRPSPTESVKQVSPNLAQVSPKEPSPQITKQAEPRPQDLKPKLLRSPSGAKVFDFSQENDEHTPVEDRAPAQKLAPVKIEDNTVVVETVTVVEKGPSLDDDIFQSFNEEEEKMKRNLQDPVYREKLRKEVEEENRKQREETRYLTNLQMGQPLGPNEDNFIHEEEERLRQEKLESISPKNDIYDYNANRKDYPIIEKQINGLQHSPKEKEIPLYPVQRENEPGEYDRRYENERGGQLPHQRSGEDRNRNEYQESRGRSPHRPSSRERERHENERRKSPRRYSSSERERYEQDRRGRSPHRRQSPGQERQDQERRNRYPSSERDRYERDQSGPLRKYPSSERDRYEHDRRGRSPHRNRDEYYRENERRGRDPRDPQERRREQEYGERDRYKNERRDAERRRDSERRDAERREAERIQHERREVERIEAERKEHERREAERREAERIEAERREQERMEAELRERERREAERREAERIEAERRELERIEAERREQERIEAERRELERREAERREYERREAERREQERIEAERREYERREQERMEKERLERLERERIEKERREQERIAIEQERLERERREREEQLERERLEKERMEQERMRVEQIERERIEQERIERERREQERIQRERIEHERREQEKIEWERLEQERIERERYEQQDERRRRGHEQDRYERDRYDRERQEWERRDAHHRGRPSSDYHDDRRKDRREQERYEQERREQERRERHRREQEQLGAEERERHRQEQQQRVHEMIANQRQEEIEQDQYKEMLSKEQQYLYGASEKRRNSEDDGMWKKIEDGSGYDIYSTFIEDERSPIVCTSCGMSIVRDRAMYVRELNQYWHETCFRCVVCHVIFGSREQRSPLKVTDSLLHCENCFITNEGDKCTEV